MVYKHNIVLTYNIRMYMCNIYTFYSSVLCACNFVMYTNYNTIIVQ